MIVTYRNALVDVIRFLEPLHWKCPTAPCISCEYERDEAFIAAACALAEVDPMLLMGPPHTKEQFNLHKLDEVECPVCVDHVDESEEVFTAWRRIGLVQDGDLWRIGTLK